MTDPIVFISRNRTKEGMADAYRRHYNHSVPLTQAGKADTLVQLAYENEDAAEVTIIRLFPTADALDHQLQGANERSKKTYEFEEDSGSGGQGEREPAVHWRLHSMS